MTSSPYSYHGQDADMYTPIVVDDLLNGLQDWRNVQDIVRLTFKSLSDVVRAQGFAIQELEREIHSKVSRNELSVGLASKANLTDMSKTLSEICNSLLTKVSLEDVYPLIEDKVNRADMHFLLSNKVEELRHSLEPRVINSRDDLELRSFKSILDELSRTLQHKTTTQDAELRKIYEILDNKADLNEINETLQNKANKQSVANALHRKANRAEVDTILGNKAELDNIYRVLENKADLAQIDKFIRESRSPEPADTQRVVNSDLLKKQDKLSESFIDSLNSIKKETMQKLHEQYLELENSINTLKKEFVSFEESATASISRKVEKRDVDKMLSVYINKPDDYLAEIVELKGEVGLMLKGLREEMLYNHEKFEQSIDRKLRQVEPKKSEEGIENLKENLRESLENQKAEFEGGIKYLQTLTNSWKKEILEEFQHLKKQQNETLLEIEHLNLNRTETIESLTIKQEIAESKRILADFNKRYDKAALENSKAIDEIREETWEWIKRLENEHVSRYNEMRSIITQKADIEAVTHIISRSPRDEFSLDTLKLILNQKADLIDLQSLNKTLRDSMDNLGKELLLKANIKDVCTLLDSRQDSGRRLEMVQDISSALDSKASLDELKHFMIEQNSINEALCAENCVARWLWKSCRVKTGGYIPWEVQSVNTCPDNFLWEKDEAHVMTVAPGLYEIMLGFFTSAKPSVHLYVNGEPTINLDSLRSSKTFRRHSAGNVVGMTLIDFIALPAQASISLTFSGEAEAEGFLSLRKL